VAQVTTAFRRLLLKGIQWDAEQAGVLLVDALKAACRAKYTSTNTGQVLVGATGNGSSVTFALPSEASTLTPTAVGEACSELDDLYTDCKADLVTAGDAAPTDDEVYAEMLFRLDPRARRAIREDYSDMAIT